MLVAYPTCQQTPVRSFSICTNECTGHEGCSSSSRSYSSSYYVHELRFLLCKRWSVKQIPNFFLLSKLSHFGGTGTQIHRTHWPCKMPQAVLHIVHGMGKYCIPYHRWQPRSGGAVTFALSPYSSQGLPHGHYPVSQ
jgi:hypothetical protein